MTTLSRSLVLLLADASLKAMVVLAVVAIIAALLLRRSSASSRHLAWALGLGCALCLPCLSPVLPHLLVTVPAHTTAKSVVPQPTPEAATPLLVHSLSAPASAPFDPAAANRSAPIRAVAYFPWPLVLLSVWLLGMGVVLTQLLLGLIAARRLTRKSTPVTDGPIAHALASALGTLPNKPRLELRQDLAAGPVRVPMGWGLLHTVIIMPADAEGWPAERLRAALLHEMAHAGRCDWLVHVASQLVCALYWFNPLVWIAARQARAEAERACDDFVLLSGVPATDYARVLLDVARSAKSMKVLSHGTVAMADSPKIRPRLDAVLDARLSRRPTTRRGAGGACVVALVLAVPLAALRLGAQEGQAAPPAVGAPLAVKDAPPAYAPPDDVPEAAGNVVSSHGVAVSLDGLAALTTPSGEQFWWDTDGIPLSKTLFPWPSTPAQFALRPSPQQKLWGLALGVANPTAQYAPVRWQVVDTASGVPVPTVGEQVGRFTQGKGWYAVSALLPSSAVNCTVRVGLAAGAWEQTASWRPNAPSLDQERGLTWSASSEESQFVGQHFLTVVRLKDALTDHDQRVVALNADGSVVVGQEISPTAQGCQVESRFALPLAQVREFRLQTRPFLWRQFRLVSLQPHVAVDGRDVRVGMRSLDQIYLSYWPKRTAQEVAECGRLHLSGAERQKRLDALYQAIKAEVARVNASHYTAPFDPSVVDRAMKTALEKN